MNKSQIDATPSVVPRDAVATAQDVARILALTSEEQEELKREQLLALSRSRARLSENERRIARGVELEQHYRLTGNQNGLAEALVLQGRYQEAAAVSDDPGLLEKSEAVAKEDRHCGCDRFSEANGYNLPQQYIESYGHSPKHGGEITFIRCLACGDLNAMAAPEHLLEQKALRHSQEPDSKKASYFKCK